MKWFIKAMSQYANFNGRARRKEYWYFMLFYCMLAVVMVSFDFFLGNIDDDNPEKEGIFETLFLVFTIIPHLAVTVRRLHDIGKRGFWVLIEIIPFVGLIILLIMLLKEGDFGENAYGPDPKYFARPNYFEEQNTYDFEESDT